MPRGSGFTDKLYWRPVGMLWHCFKRTRGGGGYHSFCGSFRIPKSRGGSCARPPAAMRCAKCDLAEMKRRGWDESGPELEEWLQF